MANFREEIEEIKALLQSQNKASAYPKLLRLQEISAVDSSALEALAASSHAILSSAVTDISDTDEEIADQALKCLGFMIYHPVVVASIAGDDADVIIESLVKLILTTKMKSVCNLGVWCLSIQQFGSSLLERHFQSLLRAIVHAIDNPIGSLSTTFEAMQAVVKLASSLAEQMRNMSSVWTPPIYRRLVSADKRDRDMSERCLLKIMSLICPPPVTLSKALAVDMKKKLLLAMKELLDQGLKIQSLQAWRWFIRILGPYALKNKHLVNEMLKIPERTFTDFDSQVQIASLVAWEGLIDALIELEVKTSDINCALGHDVQVLTASEGGNSQNEADRRSKRIKLIMAPLIGIMSSKCDVSVHSSCLSTWSYLLHKLGASVSCQPIIETVWEPIIEVVFRVGPDNKNIWLWNFCIDLLDTWVLGTNQGTVGNMDNQEISHLSVKNIIGGHLASGKCPLRHYPINCSPWNLCQLDFFIKIISILINRERNGTVTPEFKRMASDAAQRLFGSLMETVQKVLRCVSITYDEVMLCLNTIFKFLVKMCEDVTSEGHSNYYCPHICLTFLKVVSEKLEPFILESPLYKVDLELKCIRKLVCATMIRFATLPSICTMDFEDKVLPVVYLSTLYFSVVVNFSLRPSEYESLLQKMQEYVQLLLSLCRPHEVLHTFICLLYKTTKFNCLKIWVLLVNCLKECIDGKQDQEILKMGLDNIDCSVVLHLLLYPFTSMSFLEINHEFQIVTESWKLLYLSVDQASQSVHSPIKSLSEDLCAMVNECIDHVMLPVDEGIGLQLQKKNCSGGFVLLCGNIVTCVLQQLSLSISSKGGHYNNCDDRISNIKNSTVLTARFMKLFWANNEITKPSHLSLARRFLSELVKFVECLHQKEDVILLLETTSNPLLQWLSEMHILDENTNHQLQLLWTAILKSLQQSKPSINFDSSFLKFQEPLLEKALDHPNRVISDATISFWNSTYARQNKLEFPKTLLPILDKVSRNGKVHLYSRNNCTQDNISSLFRHTVTPTMKKCSKRVGIGSNDVGGSRDLVNVYLGAKRKRVELTEHQKEVRRAQQGRTMECSGHGPGIRTYTSVDFFQGNEESQDSQDIRDSESILELLRKKC